MNQSVNDGGVCRTARYNIFVLNAILNQTARDKIKGIDITIYNVMKCFDKLWTK